MGTFGDKLKRERELRGVTLDEIAEATKIGTRSLKALEDEHFDQLPGGIFNKGFVRAYAKFLGLDEEQMVSDFLVAQGDQQSLKPDVMEKMAAQAEATRNAEYAATAGEHGGKSNKIWITFAILVLVTAGVAAGIRYYKMKREAGAEANKAQVVAPVQQPVATAPPSSVTADPSAQGSAAAGTQPTNQTATEPPASAPADAGQGTTAASSKAPLELQIHVTKATWLSVQADDKEPTNETLRDSATKTVVAQNKVVLTTGNSVDVTCNGKALGILGADNQRSQLRITADCKVN